MTLAFSKPLGDLEELSGCKEQPGKRNQFFDEHQLLCHLICEDAIEVHAVDFCLPFSLALRAGFLFILFKGKRAVSESQNNIYL